MGLVIVVLLVVVAPVWVYLDATRHRIGKVKPGEGPIKVSASAGLWATAVLLVSYAFLPLYLICRSTLIRRAQERPVEVSRRGLKTALLVIAAIPVALVNVSSMRSSADRFVTSGTTDGATGTQIREASSEDAGSR